MRARLQRYLLPVVAALLALLLTRGIPYLQDTYSTLFFAAVMVSAWYGGLGPGLVATALSIVIIDHFFLLPFYTPGREYADVIRWAGFLLVAVLISSLNGKRKQVEEALRAAHQDLESRVQERTAQLAQTNEALHASKERYRDLFENANDIVYTHDLDGHFTSFNKAGEQITGYAWDEIRTMTIDQLIAAEHLPLAQEMLQQKIREGGTTTYEVEIIAKNGRRIMLEVSSWLAAPGGKPAEVQGIARNVTEYKRLEDQLRQAQKMEAIGRLAGGVAHDFNNLLMVILGNSELLLGSLDPDDPSRELIDEIKKSGDRAALLTRQLLAFGRKAMLTPIVLDLNALLADLEKMLRRLIGEDIDLVTVLHPDCCLVKADPGQIEQVILNLVVNARDAMPDGGKLILETSRVELEAVPSLPLELAPGPYVVLTVRDTGCGMDEETRSHLFEPFFTTKEMGKGTGLGLATVYGIIKQSGGGIHCSSQPGQGTTFQIYLPRMVEEEAASQSLPSIGGEYWGRETVLLVEDEEEVRNLLKDYLLNTGYTVLAAERGEEALRLCEQYAEPIHLLVTDVVMPQMSGRELAAQLAVSRPDTKVLYISGYTEDAVVRHGVLKSEVAFLQKPMTLSRFGHKVREVLDQTPCLG